MAMHFGEQVLTPTAPPPASRTRALTSTPAVVILLSAVCALTFFAGLGSTALWEPDEPRFAEATRQMLRRGDYVTPWFNDEPRFEKPVLLYWLQLPFFVLLGATEAAARLPSALSGVLAVLATFALGRRLVSPRAGLLAGLCLATTFRFVVYARQGLTDVPVTAALTGAMLAMCGALQGGPGASASARAGWACTGLAILLKGPVGLLAPPIWSLWALATGGRTALARTWPLSGLAIAAAIAVPWHAAMVWLHGRAFVGVALGYEIVARYVSAEFPGPERGPLFFAGIWIGDGLPWSLFFLPALGWAYARRRGLRTGEASAMWLATIWFAVVLVVCSMSRYKLPHYILPAYPAVALAVGVLLDAAAAARLPRSLWQVPAVIAAVLLAAGGVLTWLLVTRVFEPLPRDPAFALPVLFVGGAVAIGWLALRQRGQRPLACIATLALVLAVAYAYLATVVAPLHLSRFEAARLLGAAVRAGVPDGEPLAVSGGYQGTGLVFYARRPVLELQDPAALALYLARDGRRHCVLPRSLLDEIAPSISRPLRVRAEAPMFSVRMRRLLERDPERQVRTLVLVTAE